jgi:hypothetical protein
LAVGAAAGAAHAEPSPWFVDATQSAGLGAQPPPHAYERMNVPDVMAGGVALFDYDGDGDLDVYFSNSDCVYPNGSALEAPTNRLYRQDADGRFVDVTVAAGIAHLGYGVGVAIGDYDNDGRPDLYASNYGPDFLFRNRGDGTFDDVTAKARALPSGWASSALFFDYDRDGFLDVYVAQYVEYDFEKECTDPAGRPDFCGPRMFPPAPDVLLHNEGDGTFTDVSVASGIAREASAGLGVVSADFDVDGWPDLYVANDAYANYLWVNQGDGTFLDDALLMGAALNENGKTEAGMGVIAADFDNDDDFDLFMTHLKKETNTYYRNLGPEMGFEDATSAVGLAQASVAYTGFGTVTFDFELDGDLDLVVANGAVNRGSALPGVQLADPWRWFAEPNQVFLNENGVFEVTTHGFEPFTSPVEMSRGVATGDVDGDGDVDFVVANAHSASRYYRNDAPREGHWLIVQAVETVGPRDALGASVTVDAGGRRFLRLVAGAASYLSSSDPRAHFGLGDAATVDAITVRWADGSVERFPGGSADRVIRVRRGEGEVGS